MNRRLSDPEASSPTLLAREHFLKNASSSSNFTKSMSFAATWRHQKTDTRWTMTIFIPILRGSMVSVARSTIGIYIEHLGNIKCRYRYMSCRTASTHCMQFWCVLMFFWFPSTRVAETSLSWSCTSQRHSRRVVVMNWKVFDSQSSHFKMLPSNLRLDLVHPGDSSPLPFAGSYLKLSKELIYRQC